MKCKRCHRPLTNHAAIAAGIGAVCEKKNSSADLRAEKRTIARKLSTRPDGSRRYAIIGEPDIRVSIAGTGIGKRKAACPCMTAELFGTMCRHILAAAEIDDRLNLNQGV